MNDIRARFEEIWQVPEGVYWHEEASEYWTNNHTYEDSMDEWNARLDTFTRCQETNPMVGVIVDDLIRELERLSMHVDTYDQASIFCTVQNAKQIMEQKK